MTIPQIVNALGADGERPLSPAELRQRAERNRAEAFDGICAKYRLQPAQLGAMPPDRIVPMLRSIIGPDKPIDIPRLPQHITSYIASKRSQ